MIPFPDIDPVALQLGPFALRWYGLAYVAGFIGGLWYMRWISQRHPAPNLTSTVVENLFVAVILGIILGGRLGYVLFYNVEYYLAHPGHILKTWEGGMSYHGGMLGVILACAWLAWRNRVHVFDITDRIAPGICFGLFFGRIANFINGELYGRVTDVPWAMVFPHGGPDPRHPSQLYQAGLEGIVFFLILHTVARKRVRRYELSGLYLLFYGIFRSVAEFWRQPDNLPHLQHGIFTVITMGQLLSLPMIVGGLALLAYSRKVARERA